MYDTWARVILSWKYCKSFINDKYDKKKIECELSKEKALRAGVSIRVGPIMETSQNRFEHRWSYQLRLMQATWPK